MIYYCYGKTIELGGYPLFGGANPPDERKEGDADDYISGFLFILYVHCCPYQSALSDF